MRIGKSSPFLLYNVQVDSAEVPDMLRRGIVLGYEHAAESLLLEGESSIIILSYFYKFLSVLDVFVLFCA
jgi:hypothetical protein